MLGCEMARSFWFRPNEPLPSIWCRHELCYREVRLTSPTVPDRCPGCSRMTKDGGDWWTVQRPEGKPIKGTLTDKDGEFLRCQGIQPWEGGIDTE